jgi:prolyl-tRNA editing enzyme YbaK/EbsC (Cys-tRNA(Pro) deacylase)
MQTLGNLQPTSALDHPELLAPSTLEMIKTLPENSEIGVAEIDPSFSDTAAFCAKYGITPDITCNCVVIEAKRGDKVTLAACVIQATTRADVNGLVRRTLDARKASFAPMDTAVAQSGMEYGAITPIGLPNSLASSWPILIDSKILDLPQIVIGSGIRKSKLILPGKLLASLPNAQVLEGLGKSHI